MKNLSSILSLAALLAFIPPLRAEVALNDSGAFVRVDASRKVVLPYLQLLDASKKGATKLTGKTPVGSGMQLAYENGTKADVSVSGNEVSFRYTSVSSDVVHLKTEIDLGFAPVFGGRWKTDLADYQPFPELQPPKPHLLQAHIRQFEVAYPTGEKLFITFPPSTYVELTDLRHWGTKKFKLGISIPVNRDAPDYPFSMHVTEAAPLADGSMPPKFIIDKFGQYALKDWPGKIKSEEDLKEDVTRDKEYYGSLTPPPLDKFGGLPGSREKLEFQQTGYFHLEQKGKRWHLVDPEGNWFHHLGVCAFAASYSSTYFQGRESKYEWIPEYDGPFATALGRAGTGERDGEVNFLLANRIRKYGLPYDYKAFTAEMIYRVRKFGFNSTGAFGAGNDEAKNEANFPYVAGLPMSGVPMLLREVWDPFDEKTRASLDKVMVRLTARAQDSLLIGRFLANEPVFEELPKAVPGYGEDKACKRRLIQMLEEKYKTVEAFNQAWGVSTASFEDAVKQRLTVKTKAASGDMREFMTLFFEEYFQFITALVRKYDPNHLILGCRLQPGSINNENLCRIGSKYVDIWSCNYYSYGIDEEFLKKIYSWTGKPMILSEFYYNSFADSGVAGGAKDVGSQQERGLAYRNYVEHSASIPFVVGVEWFTLTDASQTGVGFAKYSGENPNSGLINVADRPWKPMIAEMIKTNYDIYKVASGERRRFVFDHPKFNGKGVGKNSAVASRVPAPLKIDGAGADWPGIPPTRIGGDRLVEGSAADGFEAAFKLAWDEQYFYFLVDVNDQTPMKNDSPGPTLWKGDGVEVFFGSEELDKGGQLLFTDRQILLSASPASLEKHHFINAPEQYPCQVAVAPKEGDSGYIMEVAIPWEALACKPAVNQAFAFNLGLDDSLDGKKRDKQLMWSGTTRTSGDRGEWGRVRLLGGQ